MKPSYGDAGGTSRHEAQFKTEVYLRRRTEVSDKQRLHLRRPTKVKQKKSRAARRARSPFLFKKKALRAGHEAHLKSRAGATRTDSNTDTSPTTTGMVHRYSFSKAQTTRRPTSGPTATSPKKKRRRRSAEGAIISDRRRSAEGGPTYMRGPPRSGERRAMNEKQRETWENGVSHTKREA